MEDLGDEKVTLELDPYEYGVVFHSLKDKRNEMLKENRPTDAIDDVLLKVIGLREVLLENGEQDRIDRERRGKKAKRGWRGHEAR